MDATTKQRPALLTQREVAGILGVSRRTMHKILLAGSLKPVWIAGLGYPRYRRSDVEALVRDGRAP
jgi:predicted site-specific integrase-resolvase